MTSVRTTPNWQMVFFSLIAVTRGVLYAFPQTERLPPGLSLLPTDFVVVYGLIWFGAGCFGLVAAFAHRRNRVARWAIAAMCAAWSAAYTIGAIEVDSHSWSGAAFFFLIAGAIYCTPPRELIIQIPSESDQ